MSAIHLIGWGIESLEGVDGNFEIGEVSVLIPHCIGREIARCEMGIADDGFDFGVHLVACPDVELMTHEAAAFSIAIALISFTLIVTLSPGITISRPASNSISPVTSVVRK